jgi:uncharacterized protein YlxW (UPF0749 family)
MAEDTEVMKVLESLVADNENLKHYNAELQNLLTETREDVRTLQEEVEEHRAALNSTGIIYHNCLNIHSKILQLVHRIQVHGNSIQAAFHRHLRISRYTYLSAVSDRSIC